MLNTAKANIIKHRLDVCKQVNIALLSCLVSVAHKREIKLARLFVAKFDHNLRNENCAKLNDKKFNSNECDILTKLN